MFVLGEDRLTPTQAKRIDLNITQAGEEAQESPTAPIIVSEEIENKPVEARAVASPSQPEESASAAAQEIMNDNKRMAAFIQKMKERNKTLQTALETTQTKLDDTLASLASIAKDKDSLSEALEKLRKESQATELALRQETEQRGLLQQQVSELDSKLEDALKPRLSVPKNIKILPGRDMTPILLDELARTEGELERLKDEHLRTLEEKRHNEMLINDLASQIKVTNGYAERLIKLEQEYAAKGAELDRYRAEWVSPDKYFALEQELRRTEAKIQIKAEECNAILSSYRKLEAEIRDRDSKINELTSNLESIQSKKQDLLYELLENGEKVTRQEKEFQFERARWKEDNRNLEFEIEKLRVELKTMLAQTVEHEADHARFSEIERQLQLVQQQKASLVEELSAKSSQLSSAQNMISEQKIQIAKLGYIKDSHQALLNRTTELESKLIDTESARSALRHEIAYLKQKEDTNQLLRESLVQKTKESEEHAANSKSECDKLRKQLAEREGELLGVRNDLLSIGQKYEELTRRLSAERNSELHSSSEQTLGEGVVNPRGSAIEEGEEIRSELKLLKLRSAQAATESQKLKELTDQLRTQLGQKEEALKLLESQKAEMKRENTLLAQKLMERSQELKMLKEKEAKLSQEYQQLLAQSADIENLRQQLANLNADLPVLKQKAEESIKLQTLLSEKEATLSNLRMTVAHQQSKIASMENSAKQSPVAIESPSGSPSPQQPDPQVRVLQSRLKAAQDRLAEQEAELSKALRRETMVKEEATAEQEKLKGEQIVR